MALPHGVNSSCRHSPEFSGYRPSVWGTACNPWPRWSDLRRTVGRVVRAGWAPPQKGLGEACWGRCVLTQAHPEAAALHRDPTCRTGMYSEGPQPGNGAAFRCHSSQLACAPGLSKMGV